MYEELPLLLSPKWLWTSYFPWKRCASSCARSINAMSDGNVGHYSMRINGSMKIVNSSKSARKQEVCDDHLAA